MRSRRHDGARRLAGDREHVELRRYAEGQCLLERIAEDMRVRVDKSGKQSLANTVDDRCTGRSGDGWSDSGDPAVRNENVPYAEHFRPVEDVCLPDECRLRRLRVHLAGEGHHQESDCNRFDA